MSINSFRAASARSRLSASWDDERKYARAAYGEMNERTSQVADVRYSLTQASEDSALSKRNSDIQVCARDIERPAFKSFIPAAVVSSDNSTMEKAFCIHLTAP